MDKAQHIFEKLAKEKNKHHSRNLAVGTAGVIGAEMLNPTSPIYGAPIRKVVYSPIIKSIKDHPTSVAEKLTPAIEAEASKRKVTLRTFNRHPQGGLYQKALRTAEISKKLPEFAFHELGHAKLHDKLPMLMKTRGIGQGVASLTALGTAVSDKDSNFSKAMPYVAAAGVTPMLADEAYASRHALRALKKNKASKATIRLARKNMGKAFGTYGLMAAGAVAAPVLIRKFKKGKNE